MIVSAEGLTREFVVGRRRARRRITAVDGIDLAIEPGETVGFLGPNGAGKSTTIKMLTGILVPTSGHLTVCGLDPVASRRELARRIGVVFGQRSALWWDLPLLDSFELLRTIHRVSPADYRVRLERCTEVLGLADFLATPVRQLSLGQRMRGEVTAALLHAPPLLVLDEPTVGLDLVSKERLRAFLREANAADGVTILLTTHDLPDVERLCRRVVVIDNGRVVADDALDVLRRRSSGPRELVVDLAEPAGEPGLTGLPGVLATSVEAGGLRCRFTFETGTSAAALVAEIMRRVEVRDVALVEPSIEDLVRSLYASAPRGSA
ncbi:ABC transporter ATP-binding protein [Pseudonocardia spinosispora]|uniref:ABC transporter ATP-binding protein n=1 Tax=Pseudonocardia spinosispora TaxID=103441 RepID=UPI00040A5C44|nr:ATP-binding cassette domain-containing protein [Pseudonocardia spinosispora]